LKSNLFHQEEQTYLIVSDNVLFLSLSYIQGKTRSQLFKQKQNVFFFLFSYNRIYLKHPVEIRQMSNTKCVRARYPKVDMNLLLRNNHEFSLSYSQIRWILFLVRIIFNRMKKKMIFVWLLEINIIKHKLYLLVLLY